MTKTLGILLDCLPAEMILYVDGDRSVDVMAPVVEDTRQVQPGGAFVARKGMSVDGHTFIPKAIEQGAAVIVGEQELYDLPVPYVRVSDARMATGLLAAAYFDYPSRKMIVIGVTGTDGKTTTSTLIHSILKSAEGIRPGYISTIAADFGDATAEDTGLHVTTPGAPRIQELLARMVENGLTHCVLEMTSHGLAQGRLSGVDIDIAVLTNITHEHLDYHGTFENYRAAKGRMFDMLASAYRKPGCEKVSIVNGEDPNADYFLAFASDQKVRYGSGDAADIRLIEVHYRPDGTQFDVRVSNSLERFRLNLVGRFNVANALAAISVANVLGVSMKDAQSGLDTVEAISGRMERIDEGQDFTAIVDFAHTPNALENALATGREMLPDGATLIAVFGSAGLRDVEKRRLMAEVSARSADFTVLTAEDPRTEALDDILEMMADGCKSQGGVEGETFIRIRDRGEAIYHACQMARPGDIVMVCGKGHEQSMCFGTIEHPWDDRDATRAALRGAPLATLPTANG